MPSLADDLEIEVARMAKIRGCWSPSFSPDGSRIAFVSDLNGVPQVWTVSSNGGWPDLVTAPRRFKSRASRGRRMANGSRIGLAPGGGMNQQVYIVGPDGRDLETSD